MTKKNFLVLILLTFFPLQIFPQLEYSISLEDANITSITEENDFLWVATYGQGIFRLSKKDDKWFNFSTKNKNLDNDLFYSIAVSKNYVWAGGNEGLYIYNRRKDEWTMKKFSLGGQFGDWIRSLCYDESQNILWIGRFRNLTKLDVRRQTYTDFDLTQNNDPKTNTIKSIKLDSDSLIWFGTESGVHIYRKKKKIGQETWEFINNKKGFKQEGDAVSVNDFVFEGDNVWFATDEFITFERPQFNVGGLYKYNRKFIWDKFSRANGLPANGVYCIERTGNYIWAGIYSFDKEKKEEYGKGLILVNRITGKITPIDLNTLQTKSSTINTLYFDKENLWIGTDKGLWKLNIENPLAVWTLKKEVKKSSTSKKRR
jgi:ligand-binding sensor domain-containing protein